jgi:hypothetical protein
MTHARGVQKRREAREDGTSCDPSSRDMGYACRRMRVFPVIAPDGRTYLDVVTDLMQGPLSPETALVSEIKRWATSYRDERCPGHEIRYDWENNA